MYYYIIYIYIYIYIYTYIYTYIYIYVVYNIGASEGSLHIGSLEGAG